MILVTGATGTIGTELLRLLAHRGVPVRAISRNPPKSQQGSVAWRRADLADRNALGSVLEDVDRVFLLTGNVGNMVRLQKNVIRASADAGIERIVKVSALGASDHSKSVIGVWHYIVEKALQESGTGWTILRPHVFMQNLLDQSGAIVREGRVYSPSANAEIPMIDTRDIAAVAAECLVATGHLGETYTLSGPTPISYGRATAVLAEILGRDLEYVQENEVEAFVRLHHKGQPPWLVGAQLALAEYQRAGGGTDIVTDAVEQVTGRAPRRFEDFARDHAYVFE